MFTFIHHIHVSKMTKITHTKQSIDHPEVVTLSFTGERPDHQTTVVAIGAGSSTPLIAQICIAIYGVRISN